MRPDLPFLQRKFAEFNRLCFGGRLVPVPFVLTRARSYAGQLVYSRRMTLHGMGARDFKIRFSILRDMTESEAEDVLLHEMIHYYIVSNGIHDSSPHGPHFRRLMDSINQRFGRHITICHKMTGEDLDKDVEVRSHYLCLVKLADGRTAIAPAAKTRILDLWDSLPKLRGVASCRWLLVNDPYFNRFPRVISPKVYIVNADELQPHLLRYRPLLRQGGRVWAGKLVESEAE